METAETTVDSTKEAGAVSGSPSTSLLDDVRTLFNVLYDAPELNPSNYDHDQVCELNVAMCEAFALCRDLLHRVSSNASVSIPGGEPGYAPGDCSQFSEWLSRQDLWVRIVAKSKTVYQAMDLSFNANVSNDSLVRCPRCGATVTSEISPGYHNCGFCYTYFTANAKADPQKRSEV